MFTNSSNFAVEAKFLPNFTNLKSIDLMNLEITNEFNTSLANTKLQTIKFGNCRMNEDFQFDLDLSHLNTLYFFMKNNFNLKGLYKSMKGNKQIISFIFGYHKTYTEWKKEVTIYLFKICKDFQIENFRLERKIHA